MVNITSLTTLIKFWNYLKISFLIGYIGHIRFKFWTYLIFKPIYRHYSNVNLMMKALIHSQSIIAIRVELLKRFASPISGVCVPSDPCLYLRVQVFCSRPPETWVTATPGWSSLCRLSLQFERFADWIQGSEYWLKQRASVCLNFEADFMLFSYSEFVNHHYPRSGGIW